MSTLPRVRHCGNRPANQDQPTYLRLAEKVAHYTNLQTCGSPWACPGCAAKIAAGRVTEVSRAVTKHEDQGGGVALLTATFAHHSGQSLRHLLNAQQKAWKGVLDSRVWQRSKKAYGLQLIRFREVTWGEQNGWHPHFHAALLSEGCVPPAELAELQVNLSNEWLRQLQKVGLSGLTGLALRIDPWNGAEFLADYLTKQGAPTNEALGLEVAGGVFKKGRLGRYTPWDLLNLAAEGDARAYELWCEYEAATKGKRTNVWSQGLRQRLLGTDEERSDEDLAAAEVGGQDVAGLWPAARRAIWAASHKGVDLLDACERSVIEAWAYLAEHAPPGSWFVCGDQADEEVG